MNSILPLIASASVGGIIGYSTNWVAIKMLFRPLEEKRIFGVRVPFTPGVVPKQRKALGSSIGSTVNNYLFTNEALKEVFENDTVNSKLHNFVKKQVNHLRQSNKTANMVLAELKIDSDTISTQLAHIIHENLDFETLGSNLQQTISPLTTKLASITVGDIASHIEDNELNKYEAKMAAFLERFLKEKLEYAESNNLSLRELLSDEVLEILKNSIQYNAPNMLAWLSKQLDSDDTKKLIEKYLADLFTGNFLGSILGGILPPATLSNMICDKFKEKLATPQTLIFVQNKLDLIFNNVSNKEIIKLIPENVTMSIPQISTVIVKEALPLLNNTLKSSLEKHGLLTLNELGEKFNYNISDLLSKQISSTVNNYLESEDNIKNLILPMVSFLLDMPISQLTQKIDNHTIKNLSNALSTIVLSFIDKYGNDFLEVLDVKSMVEKQIDKLELLQVEEIVLSVMNNQLKAITSFGLLLGAILGLILPFINTWISSL